MPDPKLQMPSYLRRTTTQSSTANSNSNSSSTASSSSTTTKEDKLWDWEGYFRFMCVSATYVNVKEADMICVRAGLFHGTDALCKIKSSKEVAHAHPRWDDLLEFDISYTDLPRATKLCLSICSIRKRKNEKADVTMLYYGNLNVFDYKGRLLNGTHKLTMHSAPKDMEELLYPISGTNPNVSHLGSKDLILTLGFDRTRSQVYYPSMEDFAEYGKFLKSLTSSQRSYNVSHIKASDTMNEEEAKAMDEIMKRDPLAEISEQEKDMLWKLRQHCLKMPNILPRLLDAVNWGSRDHVTQVYLLLKDWPSVSDFNN